MSIRTTTSALGLLCAILVCTAVGRADPPSAKTGPSDTQPSAADIAKEKRAKAQQAANECAGHIIDLYMHNKWTELNKELRSTGRHMAYMTRDNRVAVGYIRQAAKDHRPAWWKSCRSSSNTSFMASIWGRKVWANYVPTEMLGGSGPVDVRNGKLLVVVTWKPSMVDSTKPARGYLSKRHGLTQGDVAEAIVWHELGHNYVSSFLPLKHVMELYENHYMLYEHLQEFYAEMTALHHSSPLARRVTLLFRTERLDEYRESDAHTRMAHAIGAMILAEVLSKPEDWPSFRLPPEVPETSIERRTIIYMYDNLDPNMTFAEDKAIREYCLKFIRTRGDYVLKNKGLIPLASKIPFKLMIGDDRENEPKREAWVKQKLQEAIKAGLADKPLSDAEKKKRDEERTSSRVVIPW